MLAKILIIEDNEQDQKIITRYLQKAGVLSVQVASTGEVGVALAREMKPDLILVDTLLPGIDGFETCRQLKAELKNNVAVVMMTGRVSAVDVGRAKEMGADEYCVKTADSGELIAAIKNVLFRRGQRLESTSEIKETDLAGKKVPQTPEAESIWKDQTARAIKTLSRELERKNEELSELDRLKSKFISTVSHELRTPLTIIDGAISQVVSEIYGPVNEEQRKKLLMALKSSERLRGMIDDLLDFAKLEAKKTELKVELVNVVEIAREIHASFYTLAEQKGITLSTQCSQSVITVTADQNRLVQVFANLVGNALKFTAAGQIQVKVVDFAEKVEVAISDTGRGIAASDLPKVFGRFQQFGEGPQPGGTGLGLSISKEIIELHGGTITVESELGKGSIFRFTIPKMMGGV